MLHILERTSGMLQMLLYIANDDAAATIALNATNAVASMLERLYKSAVKSVTCLFLFSDA